MCKIKPQSKSPSAAQASPPPLPLPKYQLEAEEEPGGCKLILKATKAPSLSPPSALHIVVPISPCSCPETPISSMAWLMKFTTSWFPTLREK